MKHRATIIIAPYTDDWRRQFLDEFSNLRRVLPEQFSIEHVGSTAVSGLCAKPIIDIMLGADVISEIEAIIPELVSLGYEYMPQHEAENPDRRFFAKPLTRPRNFHLHGVVKGCRFWNEHLAFRDVLREDAGLAARYASLKLHLARMHGDDRAGYTNAKSEFIHVALRSVGWDDRVGAPSVRTPN